MTKNTKHQQHNLASEELGVEFEDNPDSSASPSLNSGLVVVATPIGNLGDLSPRATQALNDADVIACEDTRRTGALCHKFGIETKRMIVHDHNERDQASQIVERIRRGENVALVSDAGTPGISDPGHHVINAVIDAGLPITAVPGPVAAITALTLSGMPTDRFTFEGFLPRKTSQRTQRLQSLAQEPRTMVFYVAPHRAAEEIRAMAEVFGPTRRACVARELTKLFEEFIRLPLGDLAKKYEETGPKGEVVLIVAGIPEQSEEPLSDEEIIAEVEMLVARGMKKKEAAKQVAARIGRPSREVYALVTG